MAAGAERYAEFTRGAVAVGDWVEAGRIYCTTPSAHEDWQAAEWAEKDWPFLGRMLTPVAS
jgi:hypothetical protein